MEELINNIYETKSEKQHIGSRDKVRNQISLIIYRFSKDHYRYFCWKDTYKFSNFHFIL